MKGFPGDTPIVVKNNSSKKQVMSIEDFYKKVERRKRHI